MIAAVLVVKKVETFRLVEFTSDKVEEMTLLGMNMMTSQMMKVQISVIRSSKNGQKKPGE